MQNLLVEQLSHFPDYELIDSGDGEKLERVGNYILRRPEPQAIWRKSESDAEWAKLADAWFNRSAENPEKGEWKLKPKMREQWWIEYKLPTGIIKFRMGLTAFKHIGIFPEQASNWEYIYKQTLAVGGTNAKVLNLFAYTGGATMAACLAGATTTHVDSVKPVINWTKQNLEASGLNNARLIIDDALEFVKREVRRENKYNGIILDPPAYGRGPDGQKWVLENNIGELLDGCARIFDKNNGFLVLNLYALGHSSIVAQNLLVDYFGIERHRVTIGELVISDNFGKFLPLSVFSRFN